MIKGKIQSLLNPIILICGMLFFGALSVYFGQDANWDLKDYHYYNPYAFLNGRIDFDYAPAQFQSYLNPLTDLPFYYLVTCLPPRWAGFIMGALHGINFWLAYLIAYNVFLFKSNAKRIINSLICAAIGVYGPGFLTTLGTTFNDNLVSLFVLAALLLVIKNLSRDKSSWAVFFISGLILGFGAGLKMTLMVFAVGALIAVPLLFKGWKERVTSIAVYGTAVAGGFVLSSGFWMLTLWNKFHSPLFPLYNRIFKSPYFDYVNFSDQRFIPKNFIQFLLHPLPFAAENALFMGLGFRDLRFAIIYFLVILAIFKGIYGLYISKRPLPINDKDGDNVNRKTALFLVAFFAASYVVWQAVFAIYRYIVALEILGPIIIILLLSYIFKKFYARTAVAIVLFAVIAVGVQFPDWGRASWADSYFGVEVPPIEYGKGAIIVMIGVEPISYVIPFFPADIRFVRVQSNFQDPAKKNMFQLEIQQLLKKQTGPAYLFTTAKTTVEEAQNIVKSYQLQINPQSCMFIKSRLQNDLLLCRMER
ncbi:MAG: hypothetical protein HZB82_02730 [Deltaproteobacteria bacterium]|nr:hypothetical protein [Deltaproteobacteria bacterium]